MTLKNSRDTLESLKNFAYARGKIAFGHLVTRALTEEPRAKEQVDAALERIRGIMNLGKTEDEARLEVILSTSSDLDEPADLSGSRMLVL